MTVNIVKRKRFGTWRNAAAESVLKEEGMHTLGEYIDNHQATVAQWVVLRPIIEVCNRETVYEGVGRHCDLWWRQTATQKQIRATLEEIFSASRVQQL